MDKRSEDLFDKMFDKMDELTTAVGKYGEIAKSHGDDLKYVRGRLDSLSSIVSITAARLDSHVAEHGNKPERVSALAAVASVVVAAACLAVTCYISFGGA